MKLLRALVLASAAVTLPAFAALTTVALVVPGMTCATCPIAVKKALARVEGVAEVKATLNPKQAIVKFDDTKTTVETLTKATADAGFASHVKR